MVRIAIVGCGKIADSHASQVQRIRDCKIVAACDREPLMARQLMARFQIQASFSDVAEMLQKSNPDVVHITTPPESHFSLAKLCLKKGCHVYVEKPFALNEQETQELIDIADARGLKITAGHDDQFTHVARRMRELVHGGYLGGGPVHMESYYCYELSDTGYSGAFLGDKHHWVRRLPGKLLHNIISHGIARLAEFITSDAPRVIAYGYTSPLLRSRGEAEIVDELRVLLADETGTTAFFTFSSQMRPSLHAFRMFGKKNGLILDHDQETLIKLRGQRYLSFGEKFVPPLNFAMQYMDNLKTNLTHFLSNDFHMKSGMKYLFEAFYRSITSGGADPIPHREILLTARIMDTIFAQLNQNQSTARELETLAARLEV